MSPGLQDKFIQCSPNKGYLRDLKRGEGTVGRRGSQGPRGMTSEKPGLCAWAPTSQEPAVCALGSSPTVNQSLLSKKLALELSR